MAWTHRYKPARGGPASGMAASGIPAGGPGWGGEARTYPKRSPITAETQPPPEHKSAGQMEAKAYRERLAADYDKALQAYRDAWASGNPMAAMTATRQWEARMYGDPKQTIATQADTRTDDEIRADIERRQREIG